MPPSRPPDIYVAPGQDMQALYGNFAFYVQFDAPIDTALVFGSADQPQMLGAFSEISGIEATMEHKVIREGGVNYGSRLRPGQVSFGTVILKRGVARAQTLWRWWSKFAGADQFADGYPETRCDVLIALLSSAESDRPASGDRPPRTAVMGWKLANAMPVKFRVGDLNAKGSDVAVEELHLVHEGLHIAGVVQ